MIRLAFDRGLRHGVLKLRGKWENWGFSERNGVVSCNASNFPDNVECFQINFHIIKVIKTIQL